MAEEPEDELDRAAKVRVGQVLAGKWHLDRILGIGGMAAVYQATHTNNAKKVAIKVLHAQLATSADLKKRFLREGYIANNVSHPGALSVLDDGTDEDGTVFLVMELLEGESLRARANQKGGRIDAGELLPIVDAVLDVLSAAHKNEIVHRDLKADNIFLLNDGTVKVLDFGIARLMDSPETKTRTGLVMGTPEYMAPEQARGRSELVDGRADLWSVGAMLFRHLTGRHVHEAETTNEVLLLAMTKPAPKFSDVLPGSPAALSALVDKALAFDREDRFANASAMQLATRLALEAVRKTEVATTLVGAPSPVDLKATSNKNAQEPLPVSGTAVTETSDVSAPPRPVAAEENRSPAPREAPTELPIVRQVPPNRSSLAHRSFVGLLGASIVATSGFIGYRQCTRSAVQGDVAGSPTSSETATVDAATPLETADAADAADAANDASRSDHENEEDASVDLDEEEEDIADAGRAKQLRPAGALPHRKGAPTRTRLKKKRR